MPNLFESRAADYIISGPQFDMDPQKVKFFSHNAAGTGEELVYTVPPGKTLYISKIILMELSGGSVAPIVKINDTILYQAQLGASSAKEINFNSPIPVLSNETIKVDLDVAGNKMSVIGWEL